MNTRPDRFDPVRRRTVTDGPEEAVRQAFLRFLIEDRGIPRGLIAVESGVAGTREGQKPGRRSQGRSDILIHDRRGRPWMLVECKAPEVSLDQKVWNQAAGYNRRLNARYVLVTNGRRHLCADVRSPHGRELAAPFLDVFPAYPEAGTDTQATDD